MQAQVLEAPTIKSQRFDIRIIAKWECQSCNTSKWAVVVGGSQAPQAVKVAFIGPNTETLQCLSFYRANHTNRDALEIRSISAKNRVMDGPE
jgi:hypothetical protein